MALPSQAHLYTATGVGRLLQLPGNTAASQSIQVAMIAQADMAAYLGRPPADGPRRRVADSLATRLGFLGRSDKAAGFIRLYFLAVFCSSVFHTNPLLSL